MSYMCTINDLLLSIQTFLKWTRFAENSEQKWMLIDLFYLQFVAHEGKAKTACEMYIVLAASEIIQF